MSTATTTFRDPLGLARRMLTNPNPTARAALARAAARPVMRGVDLSLRRAERRRLASAPAATDHPMLLIVGAPRSGTTLIAQVLVQHLDVSFPTNLGDWFARAPISGQARFASTTGAAPQTRRNFYGQTPTLRDHSDAFPIWNRWLGTNRYRASTPLAESDVTEMRRFFAAWHTTFERPFVNKNNRNTDAIVELAEALPHAHFLVVDRDRDAVTRSLRIARHVVHGSALRAWGLLARDARDEADVDAAIADQLDAIERRIASSLTEIAPGRATRCDFAEFCRDPFALVQHVAGCLNTAPPRGHIAPFDPPR